MENHRKKIRKEEHQSGKSKFTVIRDAKIENKRNRGRKITKQIIQENFPELKVMSLQTLKSPDSIMDQNRPKPRHTPVKFQTFRKKDECTHFSRGKDVSYKRSRLTMALNLSNSDSGS